MMKRLLAIFLLIGSLAWGIDFHGQTVDSLEDGEDVNLAAGWAEGDADGKLTVGDAAAAYAGSGGISIVHSSVTSCEVYYTKIIDTMSFGMWYKTYNPAAWAGGPEVIRFTGSDWGRALCLRDGHDLINNVRQIYLQNDVTKGVAVADDTWYWITALFVRNGTSKYTVYDTTGAIVGAEVTNATADVALQQLSLGAHIDVIDAGQSSYMDDIVIDFTDATYPLLGWATGSAVPELMYYYRQQN